MTAMLDLPDPPTAVFAGNNFIAIGVLSALRHRRCAGGGPRWSDSTISSWAPWSNRR